MFIVGSTRWRSRPCRPVLILKLSKWTENKSGSNIPCRDWLGSDVLFCSEFGIKQYVTVIEIEGLKRKKKKTCRTKKKKPPASPTPGQREWSCSMTSSDDGSLLSSPQLSTLASEHCRKCKIPVARWGPVGVFPPCSNRFLGSSQANKKKYVLESGSRQLRYIF